VRRWAAAKSASLISPDSSVTPLQRSSTPADIAQAVRYLLGASAVTGTTLLVDGGQHLVAQPRDVAFLVKDA
jgi:NAD(P)-dependent dehydrogenase (short-subunit alcohol dehydrogenase family)